VSNMKKRFLVVALVFSVLLVISGCNKHSKDAEVTSISFASGSELFESDLDEFRLSDIQIEVSYSDKSKDVIPLTINMISQEDFETLFTTGTHVIEIGYKGKTLKALIKLTSEKNERMPTVVLYTLTTTVDEEVMYKVYTTGSGGYISFQLQFNLTSNDTTIDFIKGENVQGILNKNLENGKLTVLYSQGEMLSENTHLFTIAFKGNVDDLEIKLNDDFSEFYGYYNTVTEISYVKYYNR